MALAVLAPRAALLAATAAASPAVAAGACAARAARSPLARRLAPAPVAHQLGRLEDRVHLPSAVKLGSGSLGVVLLAPERHGGRQVAVKVISLKSVRDGGGDEARVWREAEVMREVRHPHLVQLIDVLLCHCRVPHVSSDPPYVCLAMEHVADSEPLSCALRRGGPSPILARRILPQLADALAALHRQGVVHRDVWPENVLVGVRSGKAVLVDLGCAEYVGSGLGVNNKLNIPYMSPEAAKGLPPSPADDCWALGLVVTEMLTGRFIAERLGRSNIPAHFRPAVLAEVLRQATAQGGALLGSISARLLEGQPGCRLSMGEVLALCARQVSSEAGAPSECGPPQGPEAPPSAPPRAPAPRAPWQAKRATSASSPHRPATVDRPCTPNAKARAIRRSLRGSFAPGECVLYNAGSPKAPGTAFHSAVVVGRTAAGHGWQVRLESGVVKDIAESEAWRLGHLGFAQTGADCGAPARPASSPPPAGGRDAPATPRGSLFPSGAAKPQALDAGTPPGVVQASGGACAGPPRASGAALSAGASMHVRGKVAVPAAATKVSPVEVAPAPAAQVPSRLIQTADGHVWVATTGLVAPPAPGLATGQDAKDRPLPGLAISQRVIYTARSNGAQYLGSVVS